MRIVVKYPPDFDGELWIEAEQASTPTPSPFMAPHWRFSFQHVETGESAWNTLVAASKAILAQNNRMSLERIIK